MDPSDQPHSLFLSAIATRRSHMAPGAGNAAPTANPLEPSSFLSTAAFLLPPLLLPPLHSYPQNKHYPLHSTQQHPSLHFSPHHSFPQHPQQQQQQQQHLTDLSCVVSPSTCSQDFVATENIMTRNLRHQLKRLEIGSAEDSGASGVGVGSKGGANSSNTFPLMQYPIAQQHQQQQSSWSNRRSSSSSEGHLSADQIHDRSITIGTIAARRQQHRRHHRSSSTSRSSTTTAAATLIGTTTATNSGAGLPRHRRHQNPHHHNSDHDHPHKKRATRHSFIKSGSGIGNNPLIAPSSYSPSSFHPSTSAYLNLPRQQQGAFLTSTTGSVHNNNNNSNISQTSSSSPFLARPRYDYHDVATRTTTTNNIFPTPTPTPPRQDALFLAPPAHLTQLSLFQYTFLLEEWVKMMTMLPSLQHLELEIINVLPSPSSSSLSGLGSANDFGSRSSSSLLLSQSLWNVHPSSASASSPTLVTRRAAAYRQPFSGSSSGIIGDEEGTDTSSSPSIGSSDNEEDLYLSGLVIDDERDGPIADASSPPLPLLSSLSLSTPLLAPRETYRATTAGFSTGESDEDDLSLRPSCRPKTHKSSHKESVWRHKQQDGTSNAMAPVTDNGGYSRRPRQQQEDEVVMTPLVLSPVSQFPSVRSLIFRGPCIIPELLKSLPNLDSLALQPSPTPSNYSPGHAKKSRTWSARKSTRSSLGLVPSLSLFLNISQILQDKCSNITRLVLTEPSIMTDPSILEHLPNLFQTLPTRLIHVELSLSPSSSPFTSPRSAGVKQLEKEVIDALVRYHGELLQVFVVLVRSYPSSAKVVDDLVFPRAQQPNVAQFQQARVAHTPLDNVFFEFCSHQQNYFSTSQQQQRGDQRAAGQGAFIPTPLHTHTTTPTAHTTSPTNISPTHPLLQVLESCPSLRIADCRLTISLQEVIASSPNWVCHFRLQVLRLELGELNSSSGKAMDEDEEAVMDMFVKSLFIGSSSARMPYSEDEVDVKVEEEEGSWRSTFEVGEPSPSSSASANGLGSSQSVSQVSSKLSFPPSPTSSGSTTKATSGSPGGSMTATLSVHHTVPVPAYLDETGLASESQSPPSSFSSWTSGFASSGSHTLTSTIASSLSSSSSFGVSGASVSDVAGQRRQDKQRRVLGQSLATSSPMSLSFISTVPTESSSAGSSSSQAREPTRGSYFPLPTLTPTSSSSPLSSSSTSSLPKFNSKHSTPGSTGSSSSANPKSSDVRSREALSAFLSACSNFQVNSVGRLMALQFFVEHQLAPMPQLKCFYLGEKVFMIPLRRV